MDPTPSTPPPRPPEGSPLSDAELVAASLSGDRQAFEQIVTRYQCLLCSLAYTSVGSISESEDVAQEVFIEAWKKLANLQEPEKLKPWLCGILRFKTKHHWRKEAKEPTRTAGGLSEADRLPTQTPSTEERAMQEEEQALLRQAMENLPENYRETLVLYYRQAQSVEEVAQALGVSEDAVKQRLSRGRKLLQEKMLSVVEGALHRSAPGPAFTAGVLAAVATLGSPAKAAGVAGAGAAAAKAGSTMKWATLIALLSSVAGFISFFFGVRANMDQTRTQRERRAVIRTASLFMGTAIVFVVSMLLLRYAAVTWPNNAGWLTVAAQVCVLAFTAGYVVMTFKLLRRMRLLRSQERSRRPDLFANPDDQLGSTKGVYISRWQLFGVPLIHAKFAMAETGDRPAVGWIAIGDRAYGLLMAWGGIAVAPISVGIVSVGVVTVGAVGFGLFSMGTVGVGVLAMGASAIGYQAFGSLSATGWHSAFSPSFTVAKNAAIGPMAYANEVNNEQAAALANLPTMDQSYLWILGIMSLVVILPAMGYARIVRKKMRSVEDKAG